MNSVTTNLVRHPLKLASRGLSMACATGLLLFVGLCPLQAEDPIKSGLKVGEYADQFLVKDCTGPAAGKTLCYYCRYADRPVVALFVRQLNNDVAKLIQMIDRQVEKHRDEELAAMVVYLGPDTDKAEQRLKAIAKERKVKRTPLTIYRDQPEKLIELYRLAPNAGVTALVWRNRRVVANRAFRSPALKPNETASVVRAVSAAVSSMDCRTCQPARQKTEYSPYFACLHAQNVRNRTVSKKCLHRGALSPYIADASKKTDALFEPLPSSGSMETSDAQSSHQPA